MSVNPNEIQHVLDLISDCSRPKYKLYWKDYVQTQNITNEERPNKSNVMAYLKYCHEEKDFAPTTLWSVFSCINKFCKHLYELDINVSFDFRISIFFNESLSDVFEIAFTIYF